jgi:hypothetical protein
VSRVVEGFYVRFFWDWLAFISGAFRWKVFAVFSDDVGDTSSLSSHAALLAPCPIAINADLDTVVNIRLGLMNGRQISSMEKLESENMELRRKLGEAKRDIDAYKRLFNGESHA